MVRCALLDSLGGRDLEITPAKNHQRKAPLLYEAPTWAPVLAHHESAASIYGGAGTGRAWDIAPQFSLLRLYFSDATHEIERLRPTERQTVQICGKHGGIECTMRALRQIIDRSTPAELCSCDCTVLISTKTCRGKQMCTRAAREAISDNHTVCWSAHSADCRALPSRSISSDACTTRPSPGACGPP